MLQSQFDLPLFSPFLIQLATIQKIRDIRQKENSSQSSVRVADGIDDARHTCARTLRTTADYLLLILFGTTGPVVGDGDRRIASNLSRIDFRRAA